jgi:hypothetical protein
MMLRVAVLCYFAVCRRLSNLSSIPYGSRPCIPCSVIGVKGRTFENVNLAPFSVIFCAPHAVFMTRVSGPQSAEEP